MAVKIVGEDHSHKKHKSCRNCSAKLEYTLSDTVVKSHTDYTGDSEQYRSLTCPKCGYELNVPLY